MASNDKTYMRLYVNVENQASITCPQCNTVKVANVGPYKGSRKPLTVKCRCGWVFHAILETRKFYRKSVNLTGHYARAGTPNYVRMIVENLSLSGIGFRVKGRTTVKIGDLLIIRVALDNKTQTEIVKDIAVRVVRQADDAFIGGEFCDTRTFYKELAWYLNPN
jgi:hypothetical protein